MKTQPTFTAPSFDLEDLRHKIEQWRQGRPRTRSMPRELWDEASAAARQFGVFRVARELKLGYGPLKQRVMEGGAAGDSLEANDAGDVQRKDQNRIQFVELSGFAPLNTREETIVEVLCGDGAKLSIRLTGTRPDIATLVNAFRNSRS